MKRFLFVVAVVCSLAVIYVSIRVETVRLCYGISQLYKQKDSLYAEKQFALCRLLQSISPENVEQRLALEKDNLGFNLPSKVVVIEAHNVSNGSKRLTWRDMLFGEKQALAESIE